MILDVIKDTLIDGIKLLPFLFLTYLLMEYLEHRTGEKVKAFIKKSGRSGPFWGSLLGAFPQCGFSAAASSLYSGRIITLGTLIAIYLSTSDEMLPILISERVSAVLMLKILGIKILIGLIAGFIIDLIIRQKSADTGNELRIEHICDHEHCNCNEGNFVKSAVHHTLQVFLFIVIVTFIINILVELIGQQNIEAFLSNKNILSIFLSGLIGLIPNCAASVVVTQMYLKGVLSFGAMMAGLLVGAGVGLLVLFRTNDSVKENLKITLILYVVGVLAGFLISLLFS